MAPAPHEVVKPDPFGGDGPRSTPPMLSPIDPDGSTASHDSNEIYLSGSNNNQQPDPSSYDSAVSPAGTSGSGGSGEQPDMTASQFKNNSDEEVDKKRQQLPQDSPHAQPAVDTANFRSRQGKDCQTKSREGVPIITSQGADHFSPSAVRSEGNYATEGFYSKSKKVFSGKSRPKDRPSARCSAFGGAPRYDWMDIETTAAIKIQAIYRRIQLQNDLDRRGISTPGMRNRRARRQAKYQQRMNHQTSADVPFPFNLCGVGLLFGDSTFEDDKILEGIEKREQQSRKQSYEREDRQRRKFRMKKKESQHMEEGVEVVESFDAEKESDEDGAGGEEEVQEPSRSRRSMRKSKSKRSSRKTGMSPSGRHSSEMPDSPGSQGSRRRSQSASRGKSKRMGRDQNEFDPAEDDSM